MRRAFRMLVMAIVCVAALPATTARAQTAVLLTPKPAIYVAPTGDGFDVHIAAAIVKKEVPATLVGSADYAAYTLKTDATVARLVGRDGAVLWSCPVPQTRDPKARRSAAE